MKKKSPTVIEAKNSPEFDRKFWQYINQGYIPGEPLMSDDVLLSSHPYQYTMILSANPGKSVAQPQN